MTKRMRKPIALLLVIMLMLGTLSAVLTFESMPWAAAAETIVYEGNRYDSAEAFVSDDANVENDSSSATDETNVYNNVSTDNENVYDDIYAGAQDSADTQDSTDADGEPHTDEYIDTEATYAEIMPLSGGFSAIIEGEGQAVTFGPGSRIELGIGSSHDVSQLVTINEEFDATNGLTGVVIMELAHGMRPGATATLPGFAGNLTFNPANLPSQLQGIVTGGRFIPAESFVRDITGHNFTPDNGVFIFTIDTTVTNINLPIGVRSDRRFSITNSPGRSHQNAITVHAFETAGLTAANLNSLSIAEIMNMAETANANTATLEDYFLRGRRFIRLHANSPTLPNVDRTYAHGDSWSTHIRLDTYGVIFGNSLVEEVQFTLRLDKNLGVTGVRPGPGSTLTGMDNPIPGFEPMLRYTIDRTGSATHDYVTITVVQPNMVTPRIEVFGVIPMDAIPGSYPSVTGVNAGPIAPPAWITPLAGGVPDRPGSWGFGRINVTYPLVNRLTIEPFSSATHLSSAPSAGALTALGGFMLFNEFVDELTNQALRMFFEDTNIGVQAVRIPGGSEGIANLYVITTTGRVIHYTDPGVNIVRTFINGSFPASVDVNFIHALEEGEFIAELYYELAGIIPGGANFGTEQWTNRTITNFLYLGRILDFNVGNAGYTARAIVGEIDRTTEHGIIENPPGTAANAPERVRDEATNNQRFSSSTAIAYETGQGGMSGMTLTTAQPYQATWVTFNKTNSWNSVATPCAVQGHYVYLRSVAGVLDIRRDSIVVMQGATSWRADDGSLTITEIVDSTGSRVYRLELSDLILGIWDENFERYERIEVHFQIRALPTAPPQSMQIRQVANITSMNPNIPNSNQNSWTPTFDIDERANSSLRISGNALAFNIVQNATLSTWTEVRNINATGTPSSNWQTYDWGTGDTVLNLMSGGRIEYRFGFVNNSGMDVGQFSALIPIPKEGEVFHTATDVQREPFGFTLNLVELAALEASLPSGFALAFSTIYTTNRNDASFVSLSAIADTNEIRTVRITSNNLILNEQTETFVLTLEPPSGSMSDYAGAMNRYAAWVHANVLGSALYRPSYPAAIRMWNYVTYNVTAGDGVPTTFSPAIPDPASHPQGTEGILVIANLTTTETTRGTEIGTWTFSGWSTTDVVVTGGAFTMPGNNVEFTGYWTFIPAGSFNVTYEVTGNAPTNFTPSIPSTASHQQGETNIAVAQTLTSEDTTDGTLLGTWTFSGWTTTDVVVTGGTFTMPGNNVEFTGNWTFIPADSFAVSYEVIGDYPAIFDPSPLPPTTPYQEGVTGIAVAPTLTSTQDYRIVAGVTELGTWTFSGWTTTDVTVTGGTFTMPGNDVEFTGSWTFERNPNFYVSYNVIGDYPAVFTPAIPADASHQSGETGIAVAPTLTSTQDYRVVAGVTELGTWTFSGWTTTDVTVAGGMFTMPESDVEFTGSWTFIPADSFAVSYEVIGDYPAIFDPSPLPPTTPYQEGVTGIAVAATLTSTQDYRVVAGVTELGTWTFSGWSTTDVTTSGGTFTMPGNDVEFTGSWTFERNPNFYVTYSVTGDAPATFTPSPIPEASSHQSGETGIVVFADLETDENTRTTIVNGEEVVELGTWTFSGWTTTDVTVTGGTFTMPGNDVEFTGSWTFTANSSFNVTYTVTGDEPATFTPAIPDDATYQHGVIGIEVAETLTSEETTNGTLLGRWVFSGWTTVSNGVTIVDGEFTMPANDVEFTGYWTFVPSDSFTVTYTVTGNAPANFTPAIPGVAVHQEGETGIAVANVLTTTATVNGTVTGTWTFSGWTTVSSGVTIVDGEFTMPGNDVEFTGTWTFVADPPPAQRIIRIYYYIENDGTLIRDTINNPNGRQYLELIGSTFDYSHVLDRNELPGNNEYEFEGWRVYIGTVPNQNYITDFDVDELHGSFVVPAPIAGLTLNMDEIVGFNVQNGNTVGETINLVAVWSIVEAESGGGSTNNNNNNNKGNLPQTGIESGMVLWGILLGVALTVAAGAAIIIKCGKRGKAYNKIIQK